MMPARDIDFPQVYEGIEACAHYSELWSGVTTVVPGVIRREFREGFVNGEKCVVRRLGIRGVAGVVNKARKRQGIIRPAPLMVQPERVGSGVSGRHPFIN